MARRKFGGFGGNLIWRMPKNDKFDGNLIWRMPNYRNFSRNLIWRVARIAKKKIKKKTEWLRNVLMFKKIKDFLTILKINTIHQHSSIVNLLWIPNQNHRQKVRDLQNRKNRKIRDYREWGLRKWQIPIFPACFTRSEKTLRRTVTILYICICKKKCN